MLFDGAISVAYSSFDSEGSRVGEQRALTEGIALARSAKEATGSANERFRSVKRGTPRREIDLSTPAKRRPQLVAVGCDVDNPCNGDEHWQYRPDGRAGRDNDFGIREANGQAEVTKVEVT